jgi:hypothetical protein
MTTEENNELADLANDEQTERNFARVAWLILLVCNVGVYFYSEEHEAYALVGFLYITLSLVQRVLRLAEQDG